MKTEMSADGVEMLRNDLPRSTPPGSWREAEAPQAWSPSASVHAPRAGGGGVGTPLPPTSQASRRGPEPGLAVRGAASGLRSCGSRIPAPPDDPRRLSPLLPETPSVTVRGARTGGRAGGLGRWADPGGGGMLAICSCPVIGCLGPLLEQEGRDGEMSSWK